MLAGEVSKQGIMSNHKHLDDSSSTFDDNNESTPLLIAAGSTTLQAQAPIVLAADPSNANENNNNNNSNSKSKSKSNSSRNKLRTLTRFMLQATTHSDRERHRHQLRGASRACLGTAAALVRDCVLGDEVENPSEGCYDPYTASNETDGEKLRNAVALGCRRWCPTANQLVWIPMTLLILLTFLEPPHWCRDNVNLPYGGCETYFRATGVPAGVELSNTAEEEKDARQVAKEQSILVPYYPSTDSSKWLLMVGSLSLDPT